MARKTKQADLAADIRAAFADSGLSRFELARRSGVPYSGVHRFIAGKRDVGLETASKLCDVLGLELKPKRDGKGG